MLETRRLLAGDVNVAVDGTNLMVTGDNQANQVDITRNQTGVLVVSGLNTTINGTNNPFVAIPNVLSINITLDGGNDETTIDNVLLHKDLNFFGNEGNDRLTVTDSYAGRLYVESGSGNDVLDLDLITGKSAKVDLGSGNNILAATALFAGKNFEVYGGDGSNTFTANTLVVNRNLSVGFGAGHDNLLFAGETFIGKSSRVYLNDGNDFAGFLPTQNSANASLQQSLHFDAGNGNDNLALDNNTGLNKRSHLDGNNGTDSIEQASAFAENIRIKNFENTSINDLNGILDSVYSQLSNAGIDPSIFGGSISSPIDLVLSSSTLNVGENDDPVSVDSGLLLNGNASQRILRAEVQISDFQSGQEILRFDNPNGIVGSFNAITGAMRLTGSALLADYQQALRDVTYENTSENPLTDTRQFEFSVTSNLETVTGTRDFRIVSANDAPVITLSTTNATVSPDDLPFVIDRGMA